MGTVIVDNLVAKRIQHVVAAQRHFLRHVDALDMLRGKARVEAKVELATFLGNVGFGEEDIIDRGNESRYAYYLRLSRLNRDFLWLHSGSKPLRVKVLPNGSGADFDLGLVHGASTVLPLTEEGYRAYMDNDISAFEFRRKHIVPRKTVPHNPCYIYIEGLFYLPSLGQIGLKDSEDVLIRGVPRRAHRLVHQLIRHVAHFIPRLYYRGPHTELWAEGGVQLPIIVCNAATRMGRQLAIKAGFRRRGKDKDKHPKYVLDLADCNRLKLGMRRRRLMRESVHLLMKERAR